MSELVVSARGLARSFQFGLARLIVEHKITAIGLDRQHGMSVTLLVTHNRDQQRLDRELSRARGCIAGLAADLEVRLNDDELERGFERVRCTRSIGWPHRSLSWISRRILWLPYSHHSQ